MDTTNTKYYRAVKNEEVHAFRLEVEELMNHLPNGSSFITYTEASSQEDINHTGYITKDTLAPFILKDADYFICGPVSFMKKMINYLKDLGVTADNIHYEFFGPALQISQPVDSTI